MAQSHMPNAKENESASLTPSTNAPSEISMCTATFKSSATRRSGPSMEAAKFARRVFLDVLDLLNMSRRRPLPAPLAQRLQRRLLAFGDDFYSAVVSVSHPARQAQPLRLLNRAHAKEDALDATVDHQMNSFHSTDCRRGRDSNPRELSL